MPSVLDYYGSYKPESTMEWNGAKSSKFGRTRRHIMARDTIRTSNRYLILRYGHAQLRDPVWPQTLWIKIKPVTAVQKLLEKSRRLALGAKVKCQENGLNVAYQTASKTITTSSESPKLHKRPSCRPENVL